ncbi:M1 family aminopeptidase, partial [Azospirillum sp. TSO22-1]|uniref:M1 family metallopeptidase n=1 Tax=Azospirillum sp. TSO22-1 TaxID=716789 RepID=UPI000D647858
GKPLPFERRGMALTLTVPAGGEVTLRYGGTLAALNPESRGNGAASGAEGAYLPGGPAWLPTLDDEAPTWRLSVRVPAPYVAVATGDLREEGREAGYRAVFTEERTVEAPSLFAGKWEVRERMHGALRLRTYVEAELNGLSDDLLDLTQRSIDGYSARIGAYPFAGFAIVSAPLPVGLGFPGLTYIGKTVLPLPFVRGQSLAHEILHDWWGNGVRVDYGEGNWCEGLTTYMGDYAAAEVRGADAAQAARLDWLRDYAALPADRDAPVSAFKAKVHDASQIVGYGKVAMIVHMLRGELGEEAFAQGIRRFWQAHVFKDAGWSDLRRVFEEQSGRDLGPFFAQWVERTGAPALHLAGAARQGDHVSLTLRQDQPVYALSVPVVVETSAGVQRHVVRLEGREVTASLPVSGTLKSVAVDPGYDLFRRLAPGEAPPTLRDVTLDGATNVVLAAEGPAAETARALAERLMDRKLRVVAPDRTDSGQPLALIGTANAVAPLLRAYQIEAPAGLAGRGTGRAWTARTPQGKPVLVVEAADGAALQALARPLPHYGRQSWLVFDGGKVADRGVWPSGDSPLRRRFD